jgi:hypothetical protein
MKSAAMIAPGSAGFAVTRSFGPTVRTAPTAVSKGPGVPSSLPTQFGKSENSIPTNSVNIGSNHSYKHAEFTMQVNPDGNQNNK